MERQDVTIKSGRRMACYCRVSTKKDAQLDSLENQVEYFTDYATKKECILSNVYADEGKSGKQMKKRPQFMQMLRDARQHKFDYLVVKDISRFARNTEDFLNAIRELKSLGIITVFTNNGLDSKDAELTLTILASVAQEESNKMSKSVKWGKRINMEKGKVPNFAFGYDQRNKFELCINPEEEKVVHKIFDLYTEEGFGTSKIAGYLNQQGVLTKKLKKANWYQKTVIDILRNELYTGKIINRKTEIEDWIKGKRVKLSESEHIVVERPELRIISDEQFNKARALLEQRKDAFNLNNKRESYKYIFSGLIKCADCGYSFRRLTRQYVEGGKTYKRWVCSYRNAKGSGMCPNTTVIDEEVLLDCIKEFFNEICSDREALIKEVIRQVNTRVHTMIKDIRADDKELLEQIKQLKKQESKIQDMYVEDLLTMEELKQKLTPIKKQREHFEMQVRQLASQNDISNNIETEVRKYFKNMSNILKLEDWSNEQFKQVIEKISVTHEGDVTIQLKLLTTQEVDFCIPLNVPLTNIES